MKNETIFNWNVTSCVHFGKSQKINWVSHKYITRKIKSKFNIQIEITRKLIIISIKLKKKRNKTHFHIAEDAKLDILAKEREVEMAQEQAELDVKHTAQQMKHLQYENQNRIGEIRAESMTQLKLAQEDHAQQELELLNDKRDLRRLLREKDEMTELQIQQLKMKQSEQLR